jgi:hypothetical protein
MPGSVVETKFFQILPRSCISGLETFSPPPNSKSPRAVYQKIKIKRQQPTKKQTSLRGLDVQHLIAIHASQNANSQDEAKRAMTNV